jgi:thiol-disulfide isomerase/thioredoxin
MKSAASHKLIVAAIALLAGAAGAYTFLSGRDAASGASAAATLHDAVFPDMTGKSRTLAEWNGKIMVLNFWATWCPPCREEIPLFVAAQKRWGGEGVQIVGLATWDSAAAIGSDALAQTIDYPILLGGDDAMALMSRLGLGDGQIPVTGVFDRQGRLISAKKGAYTPGELDAVLVKALKKNRG